MQCHHHHLAWMTSFLAAHLCLYRLFSMQQLTPSKRQDQQQSTESVGSPTEPAPTTHTTSNTSTLPPQGLCTSYSLCLLPGGHWSCSLSLLKTPLKPTSTEKVSDLFIQDRSPDPSFSTPLSCLLSCAMLITTFTLCPSVSRSPSATKL